MSICLLFCTKDINIPYYDEYIQHKNLLFAAMILLASSSFTSCGSSDETSMPQQVKQYFDKDITLKMPAIILLLTLTSLMV